MKVLYLDKWDALKQEREKDNRNKTRVKTRKTENWWKMYCKDFVPLRFNDR